jgi:hypothetical protein
MNPNIIIFLAEAILCSRLIEDVHGGRISDSRSLVKSCGIVRSDKHKKEPDQIKVVLDGIGVVRRRTS